MPEADVYNLIDWSKVNAPENDDAAARSSLASAVGQNPDEVAKDMALAKQTGLPVEVVSRNRKEVEQQHALDSLDFDHILSAAPEAKKWLEDKQNSALIIDDPSTIGALKRNLRDLPASFGQGLDRNELIDLRQKQLYGELTPEEAARADALSQSMEGKQFGTGGLVSQGVQTTANFMPQIGMQFYRAGQELSAALLSALALAWLAARSQR